jgi:hypothetical protein
LERKFPNGSHSLSTSLVVVFIVIAATDVIVMNLPWREIDPMRTTIFGAGEEL